MTDKEADAKSKVVLKREIYKKNLSSLYLPFYEKLLIELEDSYWAPTCGYRSISEQRDLYMQGRNLPGKIVTYSRPGDSAHQYGCATDWAEFKPEYSNGDIWDRADWEYFGNVVNNIGMRWGGEFPNPDKPHCELKINCSWKKIGDIARMFSYDDALVKIKDNLFT
jgi:hypothetical protein